MTATYTPGQVTATYTPRQVTATYITKHKWIPSQEEVLPHAMPSLVGVRFKTAKMPTAKFQLTHIQP